MTNHKYSGSDKAAMLMLAMGDEVAAEILGQLNRSEANAIVKSMAKLGRVDESQVQEVVENFHSNLMSTAARPLSGSQNMAERISRLAFGNEKSDQIMSELRKNLPPQMTSVENTDAETIALVIQNEHPQTMALVLAHADPQKAATIMKKLPPPIQTELFMRLSNMSTVDPEVVYALNDQLNESFTKATLQRQYRIGGKEHVAKMLASIDEKDRTELIEKITERNPELATEIEDLLFTFDDIARLDQSNMAKLIALVKENDWLIAMRGAKPHVIQTFLTAKSERAQKNFMENLEQSKAQKQSDIESVRKAILATLKTSIDQGTINIQNKDEVYV